MAEPFKNLFNSTLVDNLSACISSHYKDFDAKGYSKSVNASLDTLEFKQRSELICHSLRDFLPEDFRHTAKILQASLGKELGEHWDDASIDEHGISGWAVMPLADYVAHYGRDYFAESMSLLKEMTKRSSSEFAIRPFLDSDTDKTLAVVHEWAKDSNEHVRRLASEGTRPRLPWGMRLNKFVDDPNAILPILERLKDDPSEYVRRSVANNLNDIAKDHPDLVANIAAQWLEGASKNREKLVRHACRTLIKNGHQKTLNALGYNEAELSHCEITLSSDTLNYGGFIELTATITSGSKRKQSLMVDYIVHHQKANGTTTPKVFKWRTGELKAGSTLTFKKKHTIKPITTRVYYPGEHKVELQINGKVVGESAFELVM